MWWALTWFLFWHRPFFWIRQQLQYELCCRIRSNDRVFHPFLRLNYAIYLLVFLCTKKEDYKGFLTQRLRINWQILEDWQVISCKKLLDDCLITAWSDLTTPQKLTLPSMTTKNKKNKTEKGFAITDKCYQFLTIWRLYHLTTA